MMFSFGYGIVVPLVYGLETTGRVKKGSIRERLPLQPSGDHGLKNGGRPSPLNPSALRTEGQNVAPDLQKVLFVHEAAEVRDPSRNPPAQLFDGSRTTRLRLTTVTVPDCRFLSTGKNGGIYIEA